MAFASIVSIVPANGTELSEAEAAFLRDEAQIATEQFTAASSKAEDEGKLAANAGGPGQLIEGCGHLETQVTSAFTAENWAHQIIDLSERIGQPNPDAAAMLRKLDQINLDQLAAYKLRCLPLSNVDPNSPINASHSLSGRLRLIQWLFDDALNHIQAADIEARSDDYRAKGTCFDAGLANKQINRVRIELDEFEQFTKPAGLDLPDVRLLRKNADTASGLTAQLTKGRCGDA